MHHGIRKGVRLVAVASVLAVAGCGGSRTTTGSKIEQGPVGIGRSVNQLKGTPCACTEIPMNIPAGMVGKV